MNNLTKALNMLLPYATWFKFKFEFENDEIQFELEFTNEIHIRFAIIFVHILISMYLIYIKYLKFDFLVFH